MLPRSAHALITRYLAAYPAVALVGPRQAGKTTLAKSFSGKYFDLEKPEDRLRVDVEWAACAAGDALVVLDEIQAMPALTARMRAAIDEDRSRMGRFLVLGSIAPALMQEVGEALTGRMALCELPLLLLEEVGADRLDALWRFGGYPDGGVLDPKRFPEWQRFYLSLMAQRDLPNWGLPARPMQTERLFRMLAAVHGQVWNASRIGKSLGMSYHTVASYVDFLEHAWLVRRVPAFATNIRKRVIKSPKLYWRDTGLLHALLGLDSQSELLDQPWVGMSWEGWVIGQVLDLLSTRGEPFQAFHVRTSDQYEIDLVLQYRGALWAFEVKLTSSPAPEDLARLENTAHLVDADRWALISRTPRPTHDDTRGSIDLATALEWLGG